MSINEFSLPNVNNNTCRQESRKEAAGGPPRVEDAWLGLEGLW